MDGPDIGWYLIVAAMLFGIGALGVMLRRSPLIVLLSLEIMLNASNLTLIAFARQRGDLTGQVFALAVMAMAAAEVAIGLGLIVAMARRQLVLDVDQASTLRGKLSSAPGSACSRRSPEHSGSRSPASASHVALRAGSRRSPPSSPSEARSSRSSACGPRTRPIASRSRPPTRGSPPATSRLMSRSCSTRSRAR